MRTAIITTTTHHDDHHHDHDHDHEHSHGDGESRMVKIEQDLLAKNNAYAADNRVTFNMRRRSRAEPCF